MKGWMLMKKEYSSLEFSVVMFCDEDIITASSQDPESLFDFQIGDFEDSWSELFGGSI